MGDESSGGIHGDDDDSAGELMPTLVEICSDCDDSDIIDGRLACKHLGAWLESGGRRKWVLSCCELTRLHDTPGSKCANPATPDKWAGADRPRRLVRLPIVAASAFTVDRLECQARACIGHPSGREDAIPPCPDRAGCTGLRGDSCPRGEWPDGPLEGDELKAWTTRLNAQR